MDTIRKRWKLFGLPWSVLLWLGCAATSEGPLRYELSGVVTHGGQPVPVGMIRFTPDTDKGNHGPGTIAMVKQGRYRTRSGKGTVGGAMIVEISGFDGVPTKVDGETIASGTPLFEPYRTEADLPREAATLDFDVPLSAGIVK